MKHNLGAGLAVLALSAALAACGGSTGTAPATTTPAATAGSPAASATGSTAVDLKTASSTAGAIVVDAKGMSVYFFTKDVKDSGTSACTDACLAAWPPVTTTSGRPSADGVTGTLGTIATPDGKKQVTLGGTAAVLLREGRQARRHPGPRRKQCLVPGHPVGCHGQGRRWSLLRSPGLRATAPGAVFGEAGCPTARGRGPACG